MIRILKALPFDVERLTASNLGRAIKLLASDKEASSRITSTATELKEQWHKLIDEANIGSSPSRSEDQSENARKKARQDSHPLSSGFGQDISQLPKFNKAKSASLPSPKSSAAKPMPRSNPDFFKEIAASRPASKPVKTTARRARISMEDSQPDNSASFTSTAPQNNNNAGSASLPSTSAPQPPPAPFIGIANSSAKTPPLSTRPAPDPVSSAKTTDFDPQSAQHEKAWEAARNLKKKKTVRFNDNELEQVRIFYPPEAMSDEDDYRDMDHPMDEEDESTHYSRYASSPPPPSPTLPSPTREHGSGYFPMPFSSPTASYGLPRPVFLIPESEQPDFVRGVYFTPPRPLILKAEAKGEDSEEKIVQERRESQIPAVRYETLAEIPSSPAEPDEDPAREHESPRRISLFEASEYFSDQSRFLEFKMIYIPQWIAKWSISLRRLHLGRRRSWQGIDRHIDNGVSIARQPERRTVDGSWVLCRERYAPCTSLASLLLSPIIFFLSASVP
ncbi:hypothetical protein BC939DRAFT_322172 [Gamsiella multidivaricata]|uniref:uncharacterized protein n=1 Tax=Gamsiella multidivaricata TaxID=101098 RepID=UPI00221F762B|nr:uncharacterized protein BC939DRAFT_322172 [Gamsiella multidivaricata]KAI7829808.1 hypothetical protein BC939DRAFT_322172 [Gamsiella multidivaricata]